MIEQSEVSLIQSVMFDPSCYAACRRIAAPQHLDNREYGEIYAAIGSLVEQGAPVSPAAVIQAMNGSADPELIEVMFRNAGTAENALHYARTVRDESARRTVYHMIAEGASLDAMRATLERALSATEAGPCLSLLDATSLHPRSVTWIWPGFIAAGKLHLVAGPPGTGKTTTALSLAATVSSGGHFPDGTNARQGTVIIWSGEDDPQDTLLPRLLAAGADPRQIKFIGSVKASDGNSRPFNPATDARSISEAIVKIPDVAMLIVDPIVSAVAGDSHKNADVRRNLQPLVDLASEHGIAVVGITHFSKSTAGRDPIERITGSIAFSAIVRVAMVAAKMPEEKGGGFMLARAKSNLGPDGGGFTYTLNVASPPGYPDIETVAVRWTGILEGNARELLAQAEPPPQDPDERTALEEAKDWLRTELEAGPIAQKKIINEARHCGHSETTIKRAKGQLGVKSRKDGQRNEWRWELPERTQPTRQDGQGGQDGQPSEMATLPKFGHLADDSRKSAHAKATAPEAN
jgi:putative DNA primase/helicase